MDLVTTLLVASLAYLLVKYAIAPPFVLARVVVETSNRRRLRYRPVLDEILATSRFTIPVSILLPVSDATGAVAAVQRLLALNYPEFELIVINHAGGEPLANLRDAYALGACELFYRRSIRAATVRGIYRSAIEPRLLVVDVRTDSRGEALNCGANLARFRYLCCADEHGQYRVDALLASMHAAVEDPATVVGITTALAPLSLENGNVAGRPGIIGAFTQLASLRSVVTKGWRRSLGLAPDGVPGFTLWRRDVVLEMGGFATDVPLEQVEFAFRVHRARFTGRQAYRVLHVTEPVGTVRGELTLGHVVSLRGERQRAAAAAVWRHLDMLGNPRFGRFGLVDLPRYAFNTFVVPWLELTCLLALPLAGVFGVIAWHRLGLIVLALACGNGILLGSGLLASSAGTGTEPRVWRALALAPLELFVSRPVQLYSRLLGLVPSRG